MSPSWFVLIALIFAANRCQSVLVPTIVWSPISDGAPPASSALRANQTDEFRALLEQIESKADQQLPQHVFVYVRGQLSPKDFRRNASGLRVPASILRPGSAQVRLLQGVEQPLQLLHKWTRRQKRSASPIRITTMHEHDRSPREATTFWQDYEETVSANRTGTYILYTANDTLIEQTNPLGVEGIVLLTISNFKTVVAPQFAAEIGPDAVTKVAVRPNEIDYYTQDPINLHMKLRAISEHWYVHEIQIDGAVVRATESIWSLRQMAYTCPQTIRLYGVANRSGQGEPGAVYEIRGIRLQPNFGDQLRSELQFSRDSTTCVGYFTVPILMVLLVVTLLSVVLFVAIACLMDVHACDRFDGQK